MGLNEIDTFIDAVTYLLSFSDVNLRPKAKTGLSREVWRIVPCSFNLYYDNDFNTIITKPLFLMDEIKNNNILVYQRQVIAY